MRWIYKHSLWALPIVIVSWTVWAQTATPADPLQEPLTSRRGGAVAPNIMLTIDDSGSMRNQHMPEDLAGLDNYSIRMNPGDTPYSNSFATHVPGVAGNVFAGTISAIPGSTNVIQRQMRSPDVNTLYYNPEIRYQPWVKSDGSRYPNSTPSAARIDPLFVNTTTVNLTAATGAVTDYWCYNATYPTNCAAPSSTSRAYYANAGTTSFRQSQNFAPGLYYRLKSGGNSATAADYNEYDVNTTVPGTKTAARTDCSASSCTVAEERQNFANWFTYYRSRLLLAKGAIAEAMATTNPTFRIGYGAININSATAVSIDGATVGTVVSGVRTFNQTQKDATFSWLFNTVDAKAGNGTPLRRAIQDVGDYYTSSSDSGPWSETPGTTNSTAHKACRRAYNILVTDGYWNTGDPRLTATGNFDGANQTVNSSYSYTAARPYSDSNSDFLADYALKYWLTDLRPTLANSVVTTDSDPAFWQHLTNFTVGLGVTGLLTPNTTTLAQLSSGTKTWGTDKIDDLWHAAVNSRGDFFSAKDPNELADAIRSAVNAAGKRDLKEGGVATAAVALQNGNRKYVPKYTTGSWTGDIEAYTLDGTGVAGSSTIWTAASKVPAWNLRSIYTWNPAASQGIAFDWTSINAAGQGSALSTASTTYTATLVNFIRGDTSKEGADTTSYRSRQSKLGDFVNSTPVLAGGTDFGYAKLTTKVPATATSTIGAQYSTYLTTKNSRNATLYLGGNDGMLHAFKETKGATPSEDGKEIFAYVPRAVYSNLYRLSDKIYGTDTATDYHSFFVDGPLREADAYVKAPGASSPSWRNYLVGTTGVGAKAVFALDITDPTTLGATSIRWELSGSSDNDLGYIVAPIETGMLQNGTWVAVFGNGYNSTSGKAALYVANLETGAVTKVYADTGSGNGLGGVGVQRDTEGKIVNIYAGDQRGNLWKFVQSAGAFTVSDSGSALFNAASGQPVTQAPVVYSHSKGGTMVVFGTGKLFTVADADSSTVQAVYGVWDKPSDSISRPFGLSRLKSRSISVTCSTSTTPRCNGTYYGVSGADVDYTGTDRGWYINLSQTTGSRVVYPLTALDSQLVFVNTIAPAQNVQPCDRGIGSGANFVLPIEQGTTPTTFRLDTNGDNVVNTNDVLSAGWVTDSADGADTVLAGSTPGTVNSTSNSSCPPGTQAYSFQSTTGSKTGCKQITFTAFDRIWRRIINPPIK